MKLKLLGLNCIFLISACGSDGSNHDGGTTTTPSNSLTGVFTDSPVYGVKYQTESLQGLTNTLGEFNYLEGESVVFSIGDFKLPSTSAAPQITPVDLAQGSSEIRNNILQVIQSLDDDGNPENGIEIPIEAENAFKGSNLDISSANFDSEVQAILDTIKGGIQLISEEQANAHFQGAQKSQLLGSWVFSEGAGKRNVLSFIDDTRYIIIHEHSDDGDQTAGSVEFGNYAWNVDSGAFSTSLIAQSDNSGGLYDEGSSITQASISGDTLNLTGTDNNTVSFTRVKNIPNALQGAWSLDEPSNDGFNVLTFLSATEYALAHTNNTESYGGAPQALSGEFGSFAIQGDNYIPTASVDTDGDGGLYNAEESAVNDLKFTVQRWGDLRVVEVDGTSTDIPRLGQFTTTLVANGENLVEILARRTNGFDESTLLGDWRILSTSPSYHDKTGDVINISIQLQQSGTGTVTFSAEDINPIVWGVNSAGTLYYTETDSFGGKWFVNIAPVHGAAGSVLVSARTPSGQEDFANEFVEASFTPNTAEPQTSGGNTVSLAGNWKVTEAYDICSPQITVHYQTTEITFSNGVYSYETDFIEDIEGGSNCFATDNEQSNEFGSFAGTLSMSASDIKAAFDDSEIQHVVVNNANQFTITLEFASGNGPITVTQIWSRQ
ncbi:MAG: hypothetical protein P1U47_15100 [Zhongshania sp.]|uniref:hypothetical protein n=1 Tax=Zhongshania sp. TaxID=1971902 RepID=UPI0026253CDA|nr:hypothetical protein [Zhongshania sp.]MDF1693706.1 hypothetical protein [Zhongshania sp.]